MKTKNIVLLRIFLLFAIVVATSCKKRLDDFLFNNDNSITEYKLDNFEGPVSFEDPVGHNIPSSMINQFNFTISSEGESLNIAAIYIGDINNISTDTVIFYCHGNRDHMDYYWSRQKVYAHLGNLGRFGVLMIDYPGYGLSEGNPTETNMYEA
ncbi:MAG: hypothetical protein R3277_06520, partial [Brumimicrobium sp.]|nr:hypothetical protein [Brumimicrobium sp.]